MTSILCLQALCFAGAILPAAAGEGNAMRGVWGQLKIAPRYCAETTCYAKIKKRVMNGDIGHEDRDFGRR